MQVRAKCTHFTDVLRLEGTEWNHEGKLYEHIEPVKRKNAPTADNAPGTTDVNAEN